MGIFSWWKGNKGTPSSSETKPTTNKSDSKNGGGGGGALSNQQSEEEVPGMNGAVEVSRPGGPLADVTVFEFGSVAASTDKVTLAGYCPVSDDLEPCRWEILPATGTDAPQFRVVF